MLILFLALGCVKPCLKDASGNMTLVATYQWDNKTDNWILSYKGEGSYDEEGNLIIAADYEWNADINGWITIFRRFYYYRSGNIMGISEDSPGQIILYPNPFESYLYISGLSQPVTASMYSVQGDLLIIQRSVFNESMDIANLPIRIYIIILHQDNSHILTARIFKR